MGGVKPGPLGDAKPHSFPCDESQEKNVGARSGQQKSADNANSQQNVGLFLLTY